jgi:amidase
MSETIQYQTPTLVGESVAPYQAICKAKKASQASQIPKEWRIDVPEPINGSYMFLARSCGLLSERELILTEKYDAFELRNKLATGELSSTELTVALCKVSKCLFSKFHE